MERTKNPQPSGISASKAAKKGVTTKGKVYKATRLAETLVAEDPSMKNFNLNNFKKTATEGQLKYMLQKIAEMIASQFDRMALPQSSQCDMVSFLIKSFQTNNIFASVDHAIFLAEPNQVLKSFRFPLT